MNEEMKDMVKKMANLMISQQVNMLEGLAKSLSEVDDECAERIAGVVPGLISVLKTLKPETDVKTVGEHVEQVILLGVIDIANNLRSLHDEAETQIAEEERQGQSLQ